MSSPPAPSAPSMDHVWIGAVLAAVAARGLAWPISPTDFWWQTAMGRWIVAHGALPTEDTFSWTVHGAPFFDQPWLSQVALYALWRTGGATASLLAIAGLLVLTQGQLLRHAIHRAAHVQAAAVVVLLALPAQMTNWELRSQLLVLPIFAFAFARLDHWRAGHASTPRTAALLLVPVALWANLHGSFPLALALVALFGAGRIWEAEVVRRGPAAAEGAALGALLAAATCLHPHGPRVWAYVLHMLGERSVQQQITEWAAPTLGEPVGQLFFATAAAIALLGATAAVRTARVQLVDVAIVAAFAALALTSMRHILWFAMVASPIAAAWLGALWPAGDEEDRAGSPLGNALILGLLATAVALLLPPVKARLPLPAELSMPLDAATPVAAVHAMQALPESPQRLFHSEQSGSYLMYAAPGIPVFIDARAELYPPEQVEHLRALSRGERVQQLITAYGFDGMLVDRERFAPLEAWLETSARWARLYRDGRFSYWAPVRAEPPASAPDRG